jgi:hypothetical protein
MDLIKEKLIDLIMSLACFLFLEGFKRKAIKKDYLNRKDAKVLSVSDFKKINHLNYKLFSYIYVTGRIRRQDFFEKFYIKKYSSFTLADIASEVGSKNKITVNYENDNIKLENYRRDNILSWNPYLKFNDYMTVYGVVTRDSYTKKIYLKPIAFTQGNKRSFIYEDFIIRTFKVFQNICLMNIAVNAFNIVMTLFRNSYFKRTPLNSANVFAEACKKCNKYSRNIIFMKCNHFIYCYECFIREKKFCKICSMAVNDYTLINYK